jgi:adenylate cyclase
VVGVFGSPGVGKSRLCQDAADRWRAQGVAVAEARCPPHGKALDFAALLELLRSFLGLASGERLPVGRKKVRAGLGTLRSAGPDDVALVQDFLGLGKDPDKAGRVDARARRERLFALVCGLVQARCARSPALVLFDDAQWMDGESEAFLARLVDAVGFTRALLVVNARPEYTAAWMAEPRFTRIDLAPLADAESELLLRELLGDDPALAELRGRIQAHAAGNPFFAEETVQSLFERGALVREGGAVRLAAPVDALELPVSVQSLLAARIDVLPGSAKHVLQLAAVIGKRFAEPVLRAALGDEAAGLGEALRVLQSADLVHPESAEPSAPFTFTHPLTQEVAYAVQLQEARVERHRTVAQALQSVFGTRLGEHAALLAHHWSEAGQRSEAARWRRLAALRVTNIQPRRSLPDDARRRRR